MKGRRLEQQWLPTTCGKEPQKGAVAFKSDPESALASQNKILKKEPDLKAHFYTILINRVETRRLEVQSSTTKLILHSAYFDYILVNRFYFMFSDYKGDINLHPIQTQPIIYVNVK